MPRAIALFTRLLRHPTWVLAHLRNVFEERRQPELPELNFPSVSLAEALLRLTHADRATVTRVVANVPDISLQRPSALYGNPNASRELVRLVYSLCRLLRPLVVVETGVANGFTSAAILQALDENDQGQLISIDLPHLHPSAEASIGAAVPAKLRSRWRLLIGPARGRIRRIIREGVCPELFVQDASHTFAGQLAEYRLGWASLADRGILVTDDAGPALAAFAAEMRVEPLRINQAKLQPIGIVVKR
jgi:hypothetical protein